MSVSVLFIPTFSYRAGGTTIPLQLVPQKRLAAHRPSPVPIDAAPGSAAGAPVDAPPRVPSPPPDDRESALEGVPPTGEPTRPEEALSGLVGQTTLVETATASIDVGSSLPLV